MGARKDQRPASFSLGSHGGLNVDTSPEMARAAPGFSKSDPQDFRQLSPADNLTSNPFLFSPQRTDTNGGWTRLGDAAAAVVVKLDQQNRAAAVRRA